MVTGQEERDFRVDRIRNRLLTILLVKIIPSFYMHLIGSHTFVAFKRMPIACIIHVYWN